MGADVSWRVDVGGSMRNFTAHVSSVRSLAELEDKGRGVRRSRRRCVEMNGGHYMTYLWEVKVLIFPVTFQD